MEKSEVFYTLKGYERLQKGEITAAMEDYLEMGCRLLQQGRDLRIHTLSEALHVKPSSASKMAANLSALGYLSFQKYGPIAFTEKGRLMGEYLLFRHDVLHRFFCFLNHSQLELEQVEKAEHFIDSRTVFNMEKFLTKYETPDTTDASQ